MNHAELVATIHAEVQQDRALSKADVVAVINSMASVTTAALYQGEEVTLNGLGKLSTKTRAARKGHNPATGEAIDIPEKVVVSFSAAKQLRDAVG